MSWIQTATNLLKLKIKGTGSDRSTTQYNVATSETDPAAGGCAAITDAVRGMVSGAVTSDELIVKAINDSPGDPTAGPYCRGADKIKLCFLSGAGAPVYLNIGSPNEANLQADKIHVNPSATAMAALVTALKTYATDESGAPISAFTRGYRNRPPRRKHA